MNKAEHRAKQRIIGPILNETSMRAFEPELSRQVDAFLRALLRSNRSRRHVQVQHHDDDDDDEEVVVNASERCERLGFDIMCQLAFSYPLDTQSEATHRALISGIKKRVNRNSVYFFFPGLRVLDPLRDMAAARGANRFYHSLKTIIQARMKLPRDAKHDFYALAAEQQGGPGGAPLAGPVGTNLLGEAIFFLAAGGATTATATSGVFFYLSRNPEAYARLAAEIRGTFASGAEIHPGPRLTGCTYLRAVIDETMRMSPSTLEYMWRQQDPASAAAGEPFVVEGHVIPPGTQVAISQYSVQHDEALFPEPYQFRPERWLAAGQEGAQADAAPQRERQLLAMRRAFAPFSVGERACAGRSMAWLEMRLVIARTLWYFDFEKAPGEAGELGGGCPGRTDGRGRVDEYQLYHNTVTEHTGPNLVFTPRGDYCKELEEGVQV